MDRTQIEARRIAAGMVAELYAADKERRRMRLARDVKSRVTVGARMLREEAQVYRDAAKATHRSLYRFVLDALQAELQRSKEAPW